MDFLKLLSPLLLLFSPIILGPFGLLFIPVMPLLVPLSILWQLIDGTLFTNLAEWYSMF